MDNTFKELNVDGYCEYSQYMEEEHICQLTGKACDHTNNNAVPSRYECALQHKH